MEAYRREGDDDLETLTRYVWNICLCEALYPVFQILEVGLRNSIHNAATASFGDPKWYKTPGLLAPSAENMLAEAESELTGQQKPSDPGRVIAELNFGFWTNLLNKRYETYLWPRLLKTTFPYMPAPIRTRRNIFNRFDPIRKLRNRIFHHEPILNRNLEKAHGDILDAMGWINPVMQQIVQSVDRFPQIYIQDYYNQLKVTLDQMGTPPPKTESKGANSE
ncbi:MAG: hypothetical protein WCB68_22105 [Pyrinomonadaceae bacterium]